jgi:hypothetical protein
MERSVSQAFFSVLQSLEPGDQAETMKKARTGYALRLASVGRRSQHLSRSVPCFRPDLPKGGC